ncbi:MAG: flagellar filament capping protein FliD [Elusimicrobiota bacterium]
MANLSSVSSYTNQTSSKINTLVEMSVLNKRKSLESLYNQQDFLKTKLSKISSLRSNFLSLKSSVSSFVSVFNIFNSYKAYSSDDSIVSVSADENAIGGATSISIEGIAQAHKIASLGFSKKSSYIFSQEGGGEKKFSITVNGEKKDYTVSIFDGDSDYDVLLKIKESINSYSESKVRAAIIQKNETDYALILESKDTGNANSMFLEDFSGSVLKSVGILDNYGNILNTLSYASDATIKIGDNFTVTRSSNEIKDAIPGVTLNLKKKGEVSVNVSQDADAVVNKIKEFVNSYNAALSSIGKLIYEEKDSSNPSKGVFYSDPTLKVVRDKIRNTLFEKTGNLSLFEIGFKNVDVKSVGKESAYNLTFDESAFRKALKENPDSVKKIMTSSDGVFKKLDDYLYSIVSSSGMMSSMENAVNGNISSLSKRISFSEKMLNQSIDYYKALYSTLSSKVSSLQSEGLAISSMYSKLF